MKLITRDTDYALRAICFLAKNKRKQFCVPELVRELKIPRPFLRKILQALNKKAVLKSFKGPGGGFQLALSPEKIFLVDLMAIFQGKFTLNECLFKKAVCPNICTCPLRKKMSNIERRLIKELKSVSIASLLRGE